MRKLLLRLAAALLAATLAGCPYDASVPLGAPQRQDVDSRLTGYWVLDDPKDGGNSLFLWLVPFNDAEYYGELTKTSGGAPDRFRAYPVETTGGVFWNITNVGPQTAPSSHLYARVTHGADGRLTIQVVGSKGVPEALAQDAAGLRAYLGEHAGERSLYDEDGALAWRRPNSGALEKLKMGK